MKIGSTDITAAYIGNTAINKVYLGSTEIWTSFTGLLDLYPGAAAAYSLRRLSGAYSGPAIEVRNDSGQLLDIGFTSEGQLDTAALLTHCGSGDGFVKTWYDQSGNGRDASQTTAANQPQIVSSGSVILQNSKPCIDFDGTNDAFIASSVNESQPTTFFTVAKRDVTTGGKRNLFDGLTSRQEANITSYSLPIRNGLFAGAQLFGNTPSINQELQMSLFNGGSSAIYINSSLDGSGNAGSGGITSLGIGRDTDASDHFDGKYQELILYPSSQSSNRTGIETNINANYQIYWDGSQTSLLDTYSGAAAAYSLRALSSAYTGPLIKVRRASDNAEQDIYAKYDGTLNVEALESFCSGTNGFVKTWYDQSGNGNDAEQTTAANQPQIVSSGSTITENGKPSVQYDGDNDILSANNFNLNSSVFLCSCVATLTDLTGANYLVDADPNPPRLSQIIRTNADIPTTIGFDGSTITFETNTAINTNTQYLFTSEYTSSNITLYVNNSSDGSTAITGNNTGSVNLTIGGRVTSSSYSKIQEVIFYLSDQSSNRTGIETNINNFYDIYYVSPDADAQAFFDRVSTAGGFLTSTEEDAIGKLVFDLKAAGIWSKMKAIYPMVGASAAACAQNLKSSSFTGTFTSGWTFASNGVTSNGTSAYMDSNCSYTNMSQNSVHMSVYVQNSLASLNSTFNAYDGTNYVGTYRDYAFATNSAFDSVGDPTDGNNGFLVIYRTSSTQHSRRWNNFQQTVSHNSTGVTNASPYLAARNNNGTADTFVANTYSFASQGDGLTDTEASDFYDAVQAFQTTLSREV